jgi:hypothetical protein
VYIIISFVQIFSCTLQLLVYIRLQKSRLIRAIMECDTLIDQLLLEQSDCQRGVEVVPKQPSTDLHDVPVKRERLSALAAGGQTGQYVGRTLTLEQVESLSDEDVVKLYTRYEIRLGSMMTKTLGTAAIKLYTMIASAYLPISDKSVLASDLESDPFVGHALNTSTCMLYHKYGMYLAPFTVALTTIRHCNFTQVRPEHGDTIADCRGDEPTIADCRGDEPASGD